MNGNQWGRKNLFFQFTIIIIIHNVEMGLKCYCNWFGINKVELIEVNLCVFLFLGNFCWSRKLNKWWGWMLIILKWWRKCNYRQENAFSAKKRVFKRWWLFLVHVTLLGCLRSFSKSSSSSSFSSFWVSPLFPVFHRLILSQTLV